MKEKMAGPKAGKKGDLGKAGMLKTETLKGRMLRWMPGSDEIGKDYCNLFNQRKHTSPGCFAKIVFSSVLYRSGGFENQNALFVQLDSGFKDMNDGSPERHVDGFRSRLLTSSQKILIGAVPTHNKQSR